MKFGTGKKTSENPTKNQFWKVFGFHLEKIWGRLRPPWGAFCRLLAVFWTFKIELPLNIGPKWAPRGLLDGFWVALGGFWKGLGRFEDTKMGPPRCLAPPRGASQFAVFTLELWRLML